METILFPSKLATASYNLPSTLGHKLKAIALDKVIRTCSPNVTISMEQWLGIHKTKNVTDSMKRAVAALVKAEVDFGPEDGKHRFLIAGNYDSKSKTVELQFCPEFLCACGIRGF